jgi:hypothetical protein
MAKNPEEAYENGYTDGTITAERMRWRGTPIGDILTGSPYQPDEKYRPLYDLGFRHAMQNASRESWTPPSYGS